MPRIEFDNPFGAPGRWWKGNLHTHTTASDGEMSPQAAAERYRSLGYDFLAITDHLVMSAPLDGPDGLLIVPGAEYHTVAGDPPRCWHFVSLGTKRPVTGANGPVDALVAEVRENSEYWFVGHPYWSNLTEDDLLDVPGVPAVEVFNGVCESAVARGYSQPAWDRALAAGRRLNALAVDDAHSLAETGQGWIMLRANPARSAGAVGLGLDALYAALRRGHWYSTTGPEIHDVRVSGSVVSVRTSPARSIAFVARSPDGKRFEGKWGLGNRGQSPTTGQSPISEPPFSLISSAEYEIKGAEIYLRVEVEDAEGRRAFTNPIFVGPDGEAP